MAFDPEDKDTKAALKAAVDSAVTAAVEEAVDGLKAKNTELLGKLKKATKDAQIDPADHAALQAELDANETELAQAKKDLKAATTESEKNKKSYDDESKVAHDLLVETGLSDALLANGVKTPSFLKAAKAILSGQVKLEMDGDKRVAKVGDKPLADYVKEWATGDEGKTFVSAASNSGGGAPGGEGGEGGEALEKMAPAARLNAINTAEAST